MRMCKSVDCKEAQIRTHCASGKTFSNDKDLMIKWHKLVIQVNLPAHKAEQMVLRGNYLG